MLKSKLEYWADCIKDDLEKIGCNKHPITVVKKELAKLKYE